MRSQLVVIYFCAFFLEIMRPPSVSWGYGRQFSGVPRPVKRFCGILRNYLIRLRLVTLQSKDTMTETSPVWCPSPMPF